jgi:hypothetical protein
MLTAEQRHGVRQCSPEELAAVMLRVQGVRYLEIQERTGVPVQRAYKLYQALKGLYVRVDGAGVAR